MKLQVFKTNKTFLATLEIAPGSIKFIEGSDKELAFWVNKMLKEGAPVRGDVINGDLLTMIEKVIKPSDNNFPYAVRDFLPTLGYLVTEKHPETEEEIRKLLASYPDSSKEKQKIIKELPSMSHLEQTLLLKALKQEAD